MIITVTILFLIIITKVHQSLLPTIKTKVMPRRHYIHTKQYIMIITVTTRCQNSSVSGYLQKIGHWLVDADQSGYVCGFPIGQNLLRSGWRTDFTVQLYILYNCAKQSVCTNNNKIPVYTDGKTIELYSRTLVQLALAKGVQYSPMSCQPSSKDL